MNDNQAATLALQVGLKVAMHPALAGLIGAVGAAAVPTAVGAGIGALTGDSEVVDPRDGYVIRKGTRGRNALIGAGLLGIPAGLLGGTVGYGVSAGAKELADAAKAIPRDNLGREIAAPPSEAANALYQAFRTKSDALPLNDPKHLELQRELTKALSGLNETR